MLKLGYVLHLIFILILRPINATTFVPSICLPIQQQPNVKPAILDVINA